MSYTDKWDLSKEAKNAATLITKGLFEKAKREKKVPETYRFWTDTSEPQVDEELIYAGFMTREFDDPKTGKSVYKHDVDAEALRAALGWTAH